MQSVPQSMVYAGIYQATGCKLWTVTTKNRGPVSDLEQLLCQHWSSRLLQGGREGRHLEGCANNNFLPHSKRSYLIGRVGDKCYGLLFSAFSVLCSCGPLFGFCPDRCLSSSSFLLFLAFAPAVLCPISRLLLYVLIQLLLRIIYMLEMMQELKAQRHNPGLQWLAHSGRNMRSIKGS